MSEARDEATEGGKVGQPVAIKVGTDLTKLDDIGEPTSGEPSTKRLKASSGENDKPTVSSKEHIQQALAHARSKVSLLVNKNQLGNPMLRHVRHVRKEVNNGITADFICGPTTCVLYLSLQYHKLHPSYIYARVRTLGQHFRLRVLLVLADIADHSSSMHELSRLSLINNLTLVCTGSEREAARYLETFRSYDNKGAEGIQERVGDDYASRLNAALSSIRGINRTDVSTLAFTFGSVSSLAIASEEDLRKCPGLGERKVARLFTAMHQPFSTNATWTGTRDEPDDDV